MRLFYGPMSLTLSMWDQSAATPSVLSYLCLLLSLTLCLSRTLNLIGRCKSCKYRHVPTIFTCTPNKIPRVHQNRRAIMSKEWHQGGGHIAAFCTCRRPKHSSCNQDRHHIYTIEHFTHKKHTAPRVFFLLPISVFCFFRVWYFCIFVCSGVFFFY